MQNDLRTTQRRSGRHSLQPFEVDEERLKNIGKRTGKVFVKKETSGHFDGLRRFSDLLSTSEQERLNKNDTLKEKEEEIIQNIFANNCQRPADLPNISGISSIKKRRSMLGTIEKGTTGDMSLIKLLGDRNRESLGNLSEDLEQQSETIQHFHFREIISQDVMTQNENRVSIDKMIDDLDCLTKKQPPTKPALTAEVHRLEKIQDQSIKPKRIEPIMIRRSSRMSILPFINENEDQVSENKEDPKKALMQKIQQLEKQVEKLDRPRKQRKQKLQTEKIESQKQTVVSIPVTVQVQQQKMQQVQPQQKKQTQTESQPVQPVQPVQQKAPQKESPALGKSHSKIEHRFSFNQNVSFNVQFQREQIQEKQVQKKVQEEKKQQKKTKRSRYKREQSKSRERPTGKSTKKRARPSKADSKKIKRDKQQDDKKKDLEKIGGFIPIQEVVEQQDMPHSQRYPKRHRVQSLKYWQLERVLHDSEGRILGITTNPHTATKSLVNSSNFNRPKVPSNKVSIERELGIKSDHKLQKQPVENVYKFQLKPEDLFKISNGNFKRINIIILQAKKNKVIYEDNQGTCKIKDYLTVQQIHNFTLRNNSGSQKAVIQLEVGK